MSEKTKKPEAVLSAISRSKTPAMATIAGFMDYFKNGPVAAYTAPIIEKVEAGTLYPTPALSLLKEAIVAHIVAQSLESAINPKPRAVAEASAPTVKFTAIIIDGNGRQVCDNEGNPLEKDFPLPQRAQGWADRRLFEGASDWRAVILQGDEFWEGIMREDSIARILKQPKSAACRKGKQSTPTLSFGVGNSKARKYHSSWG